MQMRVPPLLLSLLPTRCLDALARRAGSKWTRKGAFVEIAVEIESFPRRNQRRSDRRGD